jgi:hypothetical protein
MYKLRPDIQIEITNFAENAENIKNNAARAHLRCVPFFTGIYSLSLMREVAMPFALQKNIIIKAW